MSLNMSSAIMVASDFGNPITTPQSTQEFSNTSTDLTFSLVNNTSDFRMSENGKLEYIGLVPLQCIVSASYGYCFFSGDLVGGIALYKNGLQLADSINYDILDPAILNYQMTLNPNDYLEVWINSTVLQMPNYLTQCELNVTGFSI